MNNTINTSLFLVMWTTMLMGAPTIHSMSRIKNAVQRSPIKTTLLTSLALYTTKKLWWDNPISLKAPFVDLSIKLDKKTEVMEMRYFGTYMHIDDKKGIYIQEGPDGRMYIDQNNKIFRIENNKQAPSMED